MALRKAIIEKRIKIIHQVKTKKQLEKERYKHPHVRHKEMVEKRGEKKKQFLEKLKLREQEMAKKRKDRERKKRENINTLLRMSSKRSSVKTKSPMLQNLRKMDPNQTF